MYIRTIKSSHHSSVRVGKEVAHEFIVFLLFHWERRPPLDKNIIFHFEPEDINISLTQSILNHS